MKNLGAILTLIFILLVAFYLLVLKPDKYEKVDMYDEIIKRGVLNVGINIDAKPFGFVNEKGQISGYDADLARNIAGYLLNDSNAVHFVPITPNNRLIKLLTGDIDIIIATMTITPQREEIINFSIPYDTAGLGILVRATSPVNSINELADQNVGVVWDTTAEKNMLGLIPSGHIIGFKTYRDAYNALKRGDIVAVASDDTILSGYIIDDKSVRLLPKRYTKEPYGIGFRKGKGSAKLKEALDSAITDMKQKYVLYRLHKKWLGDKYNN